VINRVHSNAQVADDCTERLVNDWSSAEHKLRDNI